MIKIGFLQVNYSQKLKMRGTKMTASKFKEDVCNIGGTTSKIISIVNFCGLRGRVNEDNETNE